MVEHLEAAAAAATAATATAASASEADAGEESNGRGPNSSRIISSAVESLGNYLTIGGNGKSSTSLGRETIDDTKADACKLPIESLGRAVQLMVWLCGELS